MGLTRSFLLPAVTASSPFARFLMIRNFSGLEIFGTAGTFLLSASVWRRARTNMGLIRRYPLQAATASSIFARFPMIRKFFRLEIFETARTCLLSV